MPLDGKKTKQNNVLSDVIPGKPEVGFRIKQTRPFLRRLEYFCAMS